MIKTAVVGMSVSGLAVIAAGWALAALNGPVADAGPVGGFLTVAAVFFLVAGVLLFRRQPRHRTGPLVQVVALTSLAAAARGGLGSAGAVAGGIWLATILLPALLILTHPDGMAEGWLRRLVGAAVGVTAALGVSIVLAAHGRAGASSTWWATASPRKALPLAHTLFAVHAAVVAITLSIVAVVTAGRLVRSDRAFRRVLDPVLVPGLVWALVTAASQLGCLRNPWWAFGPNRAVANATAPATFLLRVAPLLAVTAILAGVVWTDLVVPRLARTTAGIAIGSEAGSTDVAGYLAAALVDPSVRLVFHRSDDGAWVDAAGRSTSLTVDEADRAVMILRREGTLLGAIEFDASLASAPDAVELAATAAALALDSARLVALANARAEDARRLTARLVTSADAARGQLYSQLVDGPLRELEDIETALAGEGDAGGAAGRLQMVAAEVRRISHGLFPPELERGGLATALPQAAEVPAGRFAPAIEITAFLAADGDRAAKISHQPGRLTINLSVPPRKAALLDRVAVLGGTIQGTTITLPVAG